MRYPNWNNHWTHTIAPGVVEKTYQVVLDFLPESDSAALVCFTSPSNDVGWCLEQILQILLRRQPFDLCLCSRQPKHKLACLTKSFLLQMSLEKNSLQLSTSWAFLHSKHYVFGSLWSNLSREGTIVSVAYDLCSRFPLLSTLLVPGVFRLRFYISECFDLKLCREVTGSQTMLASLATKIDVLAIPEVLQAFYCSPCYHPRCVDYEYFSLPSDTVQESLHIFEDQYHHEKKF